jgi:HK97 family phage prohead protease
MIKFTAVPVTLDAAAGEDAPRTITGIAVPWDTVAIVSGGEKVMFKRGAFDLNAKPARLLENHDGRPIGIVSELVDLDNGLGFSGVFARSKAADDVVELIQLGAYDSVSVGAVPKKFKYDKNGVMIVSSADLQELSVVSVPAFADAIIEKIAASEPDPEEVKEEATEPQPDTSLQEETMSQETQVEASAPDAIPTSPIFASAKKNFTMPSAAEYISAAFVGGDQWRAMSEGIRAAAPDVITSDIPGVLPLPIVSPVYNNFIGRRPVIDAIGAKAMPQGGKVFIRPEVTTHTSIGNQATENTALTQGTFVITDNQVTKGTYGGYVTLSEQSIDWSQPEIISLVLDDMARIYANATDNVAADNLASGASVTRDFSGASGADPAYWVQWIYGAASTILSSSNGNLPTHLFLAPNVWASLSSLSDTADRPLFPNVGPMNAFGGSNANSTDMMAFGLKVVVDRNFAASTVIVGDPSGYEIFEQQKGAISIDVPSTLSRTIAFRGYLATLMIDSSKFVKANFIA